MKEIEFLINKLKSVLERINDDSLNYVAEIQIYPVVGYAKKPAIEVIKRALIGDIVIGNTFQSNVRDVLSEFKSALSYAGDDGSYSNRSYVGTNEHSNHLADITKKLKYILSKASNITGFSLKEGHPFYPVFWDFAFILEIGSDAYVVIGSSSD